MRTTNRLISLFAAILFSATMLADVVYEPLIVDSGFNLDVIAEHSQPSPASWAWSPLYDRTGSNAHTSCSATKEVMVAINRNSSQNYKDDELALTERCGWPNDYRDTVRCDELVCTNLEYRDVKFLLGRYDTVNALCLRPEDGFQRTGTLHFKKIGCYNKLYFLIISLQQGGDKENRRSNVRLYFTNGMTKDTTFNFGGLSASDANANKFRLTNIYEYSDFRKNLRSNTKAYACVYDIAIPDSLLLDSIWFQNPKENSSVSVYAITGRTANIAAPKEETAQVSNIGEHSFEACWAAVEDAVSYRLDVASDSAFQHILEKYNNKVIDDGTCAEVKNLVEDSAYYWRIRSVNEDGGQSASSAPKRVKTAGGEIPETAETNEDIESDLIPHLNKLYSTFKIDRTLWRDGYYNTLCLPFNMTPGEIAVSPLAGATVYKYVRADKIGNNQLNIEVADTTGIRAGVPYLIQWPDMGDIIPAPLEFHNVTISTNVGQTIGGPDDIRFVGNIGIATLVEEDDNNLFLGANNVLYWPNKDQNRMKGFRAYFQVPTTGANAVKKNTPARIVMRRETPTDIDQISNQQSPFSNKILRNGQILIIRDGQTYNLLGGKISPKP